MTARPPDARARTVLLAFAAWTLLGLSYTAAMIGSARLRGQPLTWGVALAWNVSSCWLWMALSPVPVALARRIGFERRNWRKALAAHAAGALVLGLVHHVVFLTIYWKLGSPSMIHGAPLGETLRLSLPWRLHDASVVYALLVLYVYVIHHGRAREAEHARRSALESQLATAQLQALRMQLSPHFLFNTLNGVSALVAADPAAAKAMIAKLADFLRLTLEEPGAAETPLRQELRFASLYLEIQRLRFADRLSVRVAPETETLDLLVPHLVLQPLVENALEHGLARRSAPLTLEIRSRRQGACLLLEVEDDGAGLPDPLVEGIGLANTRARLKARYGDAAFLRLSPRDGGGARALVSLPAGT